MPFHEFNWPLEWHGTVQDLNKGHLNALKAAQFTVQCVDAISWKWKGFEPFWYTLYLSIHQREFPGHIFCSKCTPHCYAATLSRCQLFVSLFLLTHSTTYLSDHCFDTSFVPANLYLQTLTSMLSLHHAAHCWTLFTSHLLLELTATPWLFDCSTYYQQTFSPYP